MPTGAADDSAAPSKEGASVAVAAGEEVVGTGEGVVVVSSVGSGVTAAGARLASGAMVVGSTGADVPTGAWEDGAAPSEEGATVSADAGGTVTEAGADVAASSLVVGSGVAAAAGARVASGAVFV